MQIHNTNLAGVKVITPDIHSDQRGNFKEVYQKNRYWENGVEYDFVQDNQSNSIRGVLRGLHSQNIRQQGKLVSCSHGSIFDVAADIDPNSKTFGQFFSIVLSEANHKQLWIPPGYAHGFCVLSDVACFSYKCTDYYDPQDEVGVAWDDPTLAINWPIDKPILSEKDSELPKLKTLFPGLVV